MGPDPTRAAACPAAARTRPAQRENQTTCHTSPAGSYRRIVLPVDRLPSLSHVPA